MIRIDGLKAPQDYRVSRLLLALSCMPDEISMLDLEPVVKQVHGLFEFLHSFEEHRATRDEAVKATKRLVSEYTWLFVARDQFMRDPGVKFILYFLDRFEYSRSQLPDFGAIESALQLGKNPELLLDTLTYNVRDDLRKIGLTIFSGDAVGIIAIYDQIEDLITLSEMILQSLLNQYPDIEVQDALP